MKDPAFLFYPNDYIGGTLGMTFEEKGAYIEVLMLQFNRGHMTIDMIRHTLGQSFGQIWDVIGSKFEKDENGLFFNGRLEVEQNKRKAYTQSRKNNKDGKNQHQKPSGHMTTHMEDEDIDILSSSNTDSNIVLIEEIKKEKTIQKWRLDFQVYKTELSEHYNNLISDSDWIKSRMNYHPGIDIYKSLEKAFNDYWNTESAWLYKKKKTTGDINWKSTFANSLSQKSNQVWIPRGSTMEIKSIIAKDKPYSNILRDNLKQEYK